MIKRRTFLFSGMTAGFLWPLLPALSAQSPQPPLWTWDDALAQKTQHGLVIIHLEQQILNYYIDGQLAAQSPVSTGRADYPTPLGDFTILERDIDHRSNLYEDAPMPYMLRLTWSGVALHGGYVPGYPASHGCIRLPEAFAKKLYQRSRLGGAVSVVTGAISQQYFNTDFLLPQGPDEMSLQNTDLAYRLMPRLEGPGPVIIHVHLGLGRLEILRQGHEVGRGDVRLQGDVNGKYFLQYGYGQDGVLGWKNILSMGNAGSNEDAYIDIHPALRVALSKIVKPGAILIVNGQDQKD